MADPLPLNSRPPYGGESRSSDRRFRPSTPEDGPAIVALMREAGLEPNAEPAHLHWKYWQVRPDWPGPRSFVIADRGALLAHGAIMPGTLRWGGREARVIHMIDWAAQREAIGAGVQLMKHVGRQTDYLLGVGGSEQTRKIMPLIGYRLSGEVTGFVKPLAPARLLGKLGGSRWKRVPRFARSLLWSLSTPRTQSSAWQTLPIRAEDLERIGPVLPEPGAQLAVLGRGPAYLRHALACPIVPIGLHALERAGRIGGYFLLSYAPGQARLADLWMNSADPMDWRALVHAAIREARGSGQAAELAAWSSDPALSKVLSECGFHARFTLPIYLRGSAGALPPDKPLRVQMLDNDAFYLYFSTRNLWA